MTKKPSDFLSPFNLSSLLFQRESRNSGSDIFPTISGLIINLYFAVDNIDVLMQIYFRGSVYQLRIVNGKI